MGGAGSGAAEFLAYVQDETKITFPWSMIDKITPRPDAKVQQMLADDGFEDNYTIVTEKHTFTAPFVNAEETQYLCIEDHYTNGRPPLELGGVLYCDRETVDKIEKMKVCTCLNPLHTAMSIYGACWVTPSSPPRWPMKTCVPSSRRSAISRPCLWSLIPAC